MSEPTSPVSPSAPSSASPRHLSELQLAAALLPGAAPPVCPVPGCGECAAKLAEQARIARQFSDEVLPRTSPALIARAGRAEREARDGDGAERAADRLLRAKDARAPESTWLGALRRPWIAGPLVAAALVLLWVAVRRPSPGDGPTAAGNGEDPYIGVKSSIEPVRLFLRRAGQVRAISDGATVMPGDALRFALSAPAELRERYALVVSVDGAGAVSVYAPFGGERSERVTADPAAAAGVPLELSGSVVLDATLGDERIWALVSEAPLEVSRLRPILAGVAAGGPARVRASLDPFSGELRDVPGLEVVSWLLRKAPPEAPGEAPAK